MELMSRPHPNISIAQEIEYDQDNLYPHEWIHGPDLPLRSQFEVFSIGTVGRGIRSKAGFSRGSVIARFTGQLMSSVLQHTLQVSPTSHVYDPYFIGLLTHSCAPNCILEMSQLELIALSDIAEGDTLTIDYALTEDALFRQFPCGCGSSNCRHWVTGRRETINEEGKAYLSNMATPS